MLYITRPQRAISSESDCRDPEAMSLILAWSLTFVEFDREIFATGILLSPPSADSRKVMSVTSKGMCTKYWLTPYSSLARKSGIYLTDYPDMTIAVT